MHQSALFHGRRFFEVYGPASPPAGFTVVEIGSQNVNGSLREVCPAGVRYIGLDFVEGDGVDVVITDPYVLPLPDASADMVVSSSCFEHSQFFWLVFLEAMRVLKPEGLFYLNAPSNGFFHQWPVDCWRFYPDAGHAMVAWARRNGGQAMLLESFVGPRSAGHVCEGGMWNDFVAVFLKDERHQDRFAQRIVHTLAGFSNGYASDVEGVLRHNERGPDFSLIESQRESLAGLEAGKATLLRQLEEARQHLAAQDTRVATLDHQLAAAHQQAQALQQQHDAAVQAVDKMQRSSSWRMTAPYRALRDATRSPMRTLERSDLLYRAVTAPLLLPAYLAYNGNRHGFYKSWRPHSGFVARMITVQDLIQERLLQHGSAYRHIASLGFSLAFRVHESGGVPSAVGRFTRVLWRDGVAGVRQWLRDAAPGMARLAPKEGQPAGPPAPLPAAVARNILVADYRIPRADVSAGERATVGILKDLRALGFEVTFLAKDMAPSPAHAADLQQAGITVITQAAGYETAAQYIERQGAAFGTFYLIRVDVAEALLAAARQAAPRARVIFHAPDLYFLREMRAADLAQDDTARQRAMTTQHRELAVMRQSDQVVVVSTAEVPVLRPMLPDTPITVFPVLYAPVTPAPPDFDTRHHVFFLGGFAHPPNINAAQWFATEVWPLVHSRLPDVEFHIVGAEAPPSVIALGTLPGVRFVGYVPTLDPVLESMRVGVAPLRYGAGIKGKVAVTLGAGIPCVCTHCAAEGMGIEDDVHALVTDDPGDFADAVVSLYSDAARWRRLSRSGQALVQDRFGEAANRAALLGVLNTARVLPLALYCDHHAGAAPAAVPVVAEGAAIDVSILIPAYNQWHLTRACLNSIIETSRGCGVAYEILLADDGSSDDTVHAAALYPGLRVVRTPSNLGFLRNCNHAARQARGQHILLLNNDTVVLPGWLKALHQTMAADPRIAIVGSKMLYPDGHIQEAGGGLLANGDGVSIGRWTVEAGHTRPVDRDHPAFNTERETDYLSGASILVRKSFWDLVGGFDERYQPAYCEDADLAMAARAQGLRVVYQPASEIVHFEHQSYAEQADANHRQLMAKNKHLLVDKWQATLQRDHLPAGVDPCRVAAHGDRHAPLAVRQRRQSGTLNVLYFSPFPSHPSNHGNQATIQQFARRFQSLGHRVHFALLQSGMYGPDDLQAMRAAWDTLDILPNTHALGANGAEIPFDGWYQDGLGEHIGLLCARHDIDIVFCSYVFHSKLLEFVPAHCLKVIDTHDKMGDRYAMLRANGQPLEFFSCTPEEEGAYLRRADVVVARRAEEARYFDSVTGRRTAIVIPHFENPHYIDKAFTALHNVGIVASANRINLALVRECLESIDRHLAGRTCPFVVHIAGQVKDMVPSLPAAEATVFRKPWVRLRGFVADIEGFYAEMDVVVSPVTMGTGINVKTVQAMAYGMPLVSTACGSKGIETDDPLHQFDDLDALALGLLGLCERPGQLNRLAELSRRRYQRFLEDSSAAFTALCRHEKLLGMAWSSDQSVRRE